MEICFKIRNGLFPEYLHDLATSKQSAYDVRAINNLCIPKFNTITYGKKSLKYMLAYYWKELDTGIKCIDSFNSFRNVLKHWKPKCQCGNCTLCYIMNL